jgi:UDP-3-O-[3-hydroxymyristoyl] glucosamine N-acyltransferase
MDIEVNSILNYLKESNLEYDYHGKIDISISRHASLNNIRCNSIIWIKNKSYYREKLFNGVKDVLLVVNSDVNIKDIDNQDISFIICKNPKEVFFSILNEFFKQEDFGDFISPDSIIKTKDIGQNVYIGHNCYIDKEVEIRDNVVIKNNVSIEGKVKIGKSTIIHSGVVIGTDGFGYFKNDKGENIKVSHYGGVVIGNKVEIGANTCIDKGTLDDTVIGDNVKISNLCHVAHNVKIHENCFITAGVVITGSTTIDKNTYIAPGAIIKNQLSIGENSLVGMGAVVIKDVEKDKVVAGVPAKVIRENSQK